VILSHRRLRAALRVARWYIAARTSPHPNDRERRLLRALDQTLHEGKSVLMGISAMPLSREQAAAALGPLVETRGAASNGHR
jgi:hypothetical protein